MFLGGDRHQKFLYHHFSDIIPYTFIFISGYIMFIQNKKLKGWKGYEETSLYVMLWSFGSIPISDGKVSSG